MDNPSHQSETTGITEINAFLQAKNIAIVGVSRSKTAFSRALYTTMMERGYNVIAVNNQVDFIDGIKSYKRVSEILNPVDAVLIAVPRNETDKVVSDSVQKGIRNFWFLPKTETRLSIEMVKIYDSNVVTNECIFMHLSPVKGMHKFHRGIRKLFGKLPA